MGGSAIGDQNLSDLLFWTDHHPKSRSSSPKGAPASLRGVWILDGVLLSHYTFGYPHEGLHVDWWFSSLLGVHGKCRKRAIRPAIAPRRGQARRPPASGAARFGLGRFGRTKLRRVWSYLKAVVRTSERTGYRRIYLFLMVLMSHFLRYIEVGSRYIHWAQL